MTFLYWVLGILFVMALVLFAVGLYEFIQEDRQDRASFAQRNQELHLRRLDRINSGK